MTRTVFLILLFCYLTKADYDARCGDGSKTGLTLDSSIDGVGGRYKVEWCTAADRNVTDWELVMRYDDRPKESCTDYVMTPPGSLHSRFQEPITLNVNCTNVCFTKYLDLIFNGTCYHIKTLLQRGATSSRPHDTLHYIINPFNKEHFTENQAYFSYISADDEIVLQVHSGYVPVTEYKMELHNENYTWGEDITARCAGAGAGAGEAGGVRCRVRAPRGCYHAQLHHRAPWTATVSLFKTTFTYDFCHEAAEVLDVAAAGGAARWWAVGGAAAALLAALLAAAWRARHAARRRQRVLWAWLARREPPFAETKAAAAAAAAGAVAAGEGAGLVLLLYARDCAALLRVAARLRALVQDATGCRVVDVYSAPAVAAAAAGAARWLRALLRGGARVLLLQTPAAAALHAADLRVRPPPALPTLSAPLLGARAAYRRPHAGDAACALALRLAAEAAHATAAPYRTYYVAEISGMPAEVLHGVTPQRRYVLPDAAPALLRDLAAPGPPAAGPPAPGPPAPGPPAPEAPAPGPPAPGAPALRELAAAVEELRAFVRDNPNYLDDELIFM